MKKKLSTSLPSLVLFCLFLLQACVNKKEEPKVNIELRKVDSLYAILSCYDSTYLEKRKLIKLMHDWNKSAKDSDSVGIFKKYQDLFCFENDESVRFEFYSSIYVSSGKSFCILTKNKSSYIIPTSFSCVYSKRYKYDLFDKRVNAFIYHYNRHNVDKITGREIMTYLSKIMLLNGFESYHISDSCSLKEYNFNWRKGMIEYNYNKTSPDIDSIYVQTKNRLEILFKYQNQKNDSIYSLDMYQYRDFKPGCSMFFTKYNHIIEIVYYNDRICTYGYNPFYRCSGCF